MNRRAYIVGCLLLLAPAAGRAQGEVPAPSEAPRASNDIKLPYGFYNDLFGATGAFIYARRDFPQEQAQLLVTGMVGTAGAGMLYVRTQDLHVPGFDRMFVDPTFSLSYLHDDYAYVSGNPQYRSQQAGTNASAQDNYIQGSGWDNSARVSFRYLLPIGWGRDHVLNDHHLEGGLLLSGATGATGWNPITSGKTFLELRPFYNSLTLNSSSGNVSLRTNGIDVSLIWDNRDYVASPSAGQSLTLRWSRDFGWLDSTNPWTVLAGELDQYFSLGHSAWFRQRVIALDVWAADSPSWEYRADGTIVNRPPMFAGAHLGGWWRMRGYRFARFSDKAAVYYCAEYRMIPRWNPFTSWRWLQEQLGVEWIQLVPFAEVGRVASRWDLGELHSSMKWDGGFGVRALAKGILLRVDVAGSPEGAAVQMMVGHPFQF